jgi:hypothetical protein
LFGQQPVNHSLEKSRQARKALKTAVLSVFLFTFKFTLLLKSFSDQINPGDARAEVAYQPIDKATQTLHYIIFHLLIKD